VGHGEFQSIVTAQETAKNDILSAARRILAPGRLTCLNDVNRMR
jgi:hypothetical protein